MISRSVKEGFFGVARHWGSSISSAFAVTVTLIIISLFVIFTYHLQKFTQNMESSFEIYASVEKGREAEEDRIRSEIISISGVSDITFRDSKEEFDYFISSYSEELREAFEPWREDDPMRDAFYVTLSDGSKMEDAAQAIEKIDGIYEVNYGGQQSLDIISAMISIRRYGTIFIAAMGLLAVFLIQNTIKLTIASRQDEITIMRNVGATDGFIRAPFVWEGIITGVIGAILPIALTVYGYIALYHKSHGVLFSNMFRLIEPHPFVLYLSGFLLLVGILVGLFASWLSVTKYLRWQR